MPSQYLSENFGEKKLHVLLEFLPREIMHHLFSEYVSGSDFSLFISAHPSPIMLRFMDRTLVDVWEGIRNSKLLRVYDGVRRFRHDLTQKIAIRKALVFVSYATALR